MPPRLKDIALRCGVSLNTVSHILNRGRSDLYAPALVEEIKRVASELGYQPSRLAQSLALRRSRLVGFLVSGVIRDGQLQHYDEYPFLLGLSRRLFQAQHHAMLVELDALEALTRDVVPQPIREQLFDGLILHDAVPSGLGDLIRRSGLPMITWDAGVGAPYDAIDRDEVAAGHLVMERLLALGHRRIAFMAGSRKSWQRYVDREPMHFSFHRRLEAYRGALAARGLEETILVGYEIDDLAKRMREADLTAVVTLGEASHPRLMQAAARNGWSVPHGLSLATFDRSERVGHGGVMKSAGAPYDRYEAGRWAAEMLLEKMASPGVAVPSRVLPAAFDAGETLGEPRG